jgi:hypothetical protein
MAFVRQDSRTAVENRTGQIGLTRGWDELAEVKSRQAKACPTGFAIKTGLPEHPIGSRLASESASCGARIITYKFSDKYFNKGKCQRED